jgi:hypothetical protein
MLHISRESWLVFKLFKDQIWYWKRKSVLL